MPLKNRRNHPPGGFQFYQPQTNWRPLGYNDFTSTVAEIIAHRRANPQFNLELDPERVGNELDDFTCARLKNNPSFGVWCEEKKKTTAPSFTIPTQPPVVPVGAPLAAVDEGVKNTLLGWVGSGLEPVAPGVAESRASVCLRCPLNIKGDWINWITGKAADALKAVSSLRNRMNLRTSHDDALGTCDACGCHLTTKVWVPSKFILEGLEPEVRNALHSSCWIRKL